MNLQVSSEHYDFSRYIDRSKWMSYWYQLNEITKLSPTSVLEIGVGPNIFKNIAVSIDIDVETVDIDPDLNPDYVASVLKLPFKDDCYDVVACFQVLEHLTYEDFKKALGEIKRVAKKNVVISLPDAKTLWRYTFHLPKKGDINILFRAPNLGPRTHTFNGQHYWEINKKNYPLERIIKTFRDQGLHLMKNYRIPENTYHHFFILSVEK